MNISRAIVTICVYYFARIISTTQHALQERCEKSEHTTTTTFQSLGINTSQGQGKNIYTVIAEV
jgi:hypothetical protein